MDLYEAIKRRRDVRSFYKGGEISDDVLAKILMAGHLAPSVGFSQPWNFIIVRDMEKRRKIKELAMKEREKFREELSEDRKKIFDNVKIEAVLDTPVNIAVTCDPTRFGPHVLGRRTIPETCQYSSVLAVENMWLAATSEGIGMGWLSFFMEEDVKKILEIPNHVKLVAYLTLGPAEIPERPELEIFGWGKRMKLSEVVNEESWGKPARRELVEKLEKVRI
ncbi:5,6-dimethylbenzimidazole synthase [Sulfuracidifex metallicus]|uniref:5,6-dimethylbenzimidazole synthase n=2 Tax=Sulfuracidifex metallicus TaxID=47303 RepID=A0A6A9QKN9_SULME|nr:5,6-dimethylbenzimidazole synthase [Sulfuracidifex metallicus]MUN29184.1 5,6-dimethylbenzimidazole synthase [Sulfuracidifex metallicus DSM 6482 = JCM 9184]WOE50295.1 5,6-dimethylbenzimidazole synthase [Sulfuracidifex metallicus DSM 6482 = JCM 9184]